MSDNDQTKQQQSLKDSYDFLEGQAKPRRIGDIIPQERVLQEYHKADEFINIEILLYNFEQKTGKDKNNPDLTYIYYVMECQTRDSDEPIYISTSSQFVARQLAAINKVNDLPLAFRFVLDGKKIYMV